MLEIIIALVAAVVVFVVTMPKKKGKTYDDFD